MTDIALIAKDISIIPLLEDLEGNRDLWLENTARQDYPNSAHKDTETIFLRWAPENTPESVFFTLDCVNYPAIKRFKGLPDLVNTVFQATESKMLGRILLVKLKPGGRIVPHIDEGHYADVFERFHVPIKTSEKSSFSVEISPNQTDSINMESGNLYFFNHKKKHWAENLGDSDRIHLIVDCISPKWRRNRE